MRKEAASLKTTTAFCPSQKKKTKEPGDSEGSTILSLEVFFDHPFGDGNSPLCDAMQDWLVSPRISFWPFVFVMACGLMDAALPCYCSASHSCPLFQRHLVFLSLLCVTSYILRRLVFLCEDQATAVSLVVPRVWPSRIAIPVSFANRCFLRVYECLRAFLLLQKEISKWCNRNQTRTRSETHTPSHTQSHTRTHTRSHTHTHTHTHAHTHTHTYT